MSITLHAVMAPVGILLQSELCFIFLFSQSAVHSGPHWRPHGLAAGGGAGALLWRLHPGRRHGRVRGSLRLHEVSEDPAGLSGRPHLPWWVSTRWCVLFCFVKGSLDNVFPFFFLNLHLPTHSHLEAAQYNHSQICWELRGLKGQEHLSGYNKRGRAPPLGQKGG